MSHLSIYSHTYNSMNTCKTKTKYTYTHNAVCMDGMYVYVMS